MAIPPITKVMGILATFYDITKAKSMLGYKVEYGFEQGLLETIEWYKNGKKY